jgi:hypothetical protein
MKKILSFIIFLTAISCFSASANNYLPLNNEIRSISQEITAFPPFNNTRLSAKQGEFYDESRDPAFQSGGPQDGPQHGYFAVPLIVIGLVSLLLFLMKND